MLLDNKWLLNDSNENLECFVLLGKNISYSLSDKIHGFIYKHFKIDKKYQYKIIDTNELIDSNLDLERIIKSFHIKGGNLTTPYKISLSSKKIPSFKSYFFYPHILENNKLDLNKSIYPYPIKSFNTFFKKDGDICFCSTDLSGLKQSLSEDRIDLDNVDNILILGSGGMCEGIIEYFIAYDRLIKKISTNKNIYVFSRKDNISGNITNNISNPNIHIHSYSLKDGFDKFISDFKDKNEISKSNLLCINALLSNVDISYLYSGFKKIKSLFNDTYFMDLNYSFTNNPLSSNKSFFENEGIRFKDGLNMLVYQAIYSECIWLNLDWDKCWGIKDSIIEYLNSFK